VETLKGVFLFCRNIIVAFVGRFGIFVMLKKKLIAYQTIHGGKLMGKVIDFKDIDNWEELFDMTFDYLTFLIEESKIEQETVIKTTYDILQNAGYGYTLAEVRNRYYNDNLTV